MNIPFKLGAAARSRINAEEVNLLEIASPMTNYGQAIAIVDDRQQAYETHEICPRCVTRAHLLSLFDPLTRTSENYIIATTILSTK